MFGPNSKFEQQVIVDQSHRDTSFLDQFAKLRDLFVSKFGLQDYDVIFLPGSGTLGVESIFFSLKSRIKVIGNEGVFKDRWLKMSAFYNQYKDSNLEQEFACYFESSTSASYYHEGICGDAVCSFPFYDIPKDTHIFVTCTNKMLRSLAGISIVCVHKKFWDHLIEPDVVSVLNLSRSKQWLAIGQTPTTVPTYILNHLLDSLQNYSVDTLRKQMTENANVIVDAVGYRHIVGNPYSPCVTFSKGAIPESLARKYSLYNLNSKSDHYQIFTYSDLPERYVQFAGDCAHVNTV